MFACLLICGLINFTLQPALHPGFVCVDAVSTAESNLQPAEAGFVCVVAVSTAEFLKNPVSSRNRVYEYPKSRSTGNWQY